ncbi:MAG: alpha/beta fold hydrolase, partial [bacterium]|nr:alpha/beta fold hydrolase [bacterium]
MNRFQNVVKQFLVFALMVVVASVSCYAGAEPAGNWKGTLKAPGMDLELIFKIVGKTGETLTATMDVPLQGLKDMKVDTVTYADGKLSLGVSRLGLSFEGKPNADFSVVEGTFLQGTLKLPLELKRVDKIEELKRPQNPKKPYPYNEEEVTVQNKAANLTLAGTLSTPKSGGPFPVVLLITGSGPQNRDEEVMGHKPFLVWADTLTRQGIAVLRLDDRGTGKSTGQLRHATTEDFAGDVLAAIEFLKKHHAVDPKRIGLLGHSEGGVIAPMVAAQSKDVAFIVMLAGTGIDGAEILLLQNELISRAAGTPEDEIKSNSK